MAASGGPAAAGTAASAGTGGAPEAGVGGAVADVPASVPALATSTPSPTTSGTPCMPRSAGRLGKALSPLWGRVGSASDTSNGVLSLFTDGVVAKCSAAVRRGTGRAGGGLLRAAGAGADTFTAAATDTGVDAGAGNSTVRVLKVCAMAGAISGVLWRDGKFSSTARCNASTTAPQTHSVRRAFTAAAPHASVHQSGSMHQTRKHKGAARRWRRWSAGTGQPKGLWRKYAWVLEPRSACLVPAALAAVGRAAAGCRSLQWCQQRAKRAAQQHPKPVRCTPCKRC